MPLYEYRCENCGEQFEVIEKFSAQPLSVHEKCGGKVNRLLSAPAFQFKGSGWYVTDYAKGGSSSPSHSSSDKNDGGKDKSDGGGSKKQEGSSTPAASTTSTSTPSSSSDKK